MKLLNRKSAQKNTGKLPGRANDLGERGRGALAGIDLGESLSRVRELREGTTERLSHIDVRGPLGHLRDLGGEGIERLSRIDMVGSLPGPVRDLAEEKLGRRRRRRWPIYLAVAAGFAGAMLVLKRIFFPGYKEEPLLGDTYAYPAAGSGTGWPEPQRTPEHTEIARAPDPGDLAVLDASAIAPDGTLMQREAELAAATGDALPPAALAKGTPSGTSMGEGLTAPTAEPVPSLSRESTGTAATGRIDTDAGTVVRPSAMSTGSTVSAPGPVRQEMGVDTVPAPPSPPAQRPETPLSEAQTEVNARLQMKQEELYAAFPGMTRHDIVQSDGDLDVLALRFAERTAAEPARVRQRLDEILGTGTDQQSEHSLRPDLTES